MSVCVIVKVGEGLVLATDSASSIIGGPILPGGTPGPQGIIKIFFSGKKIFQVGNLPVGVMAWGAGSFKERSIASLIEEFESTEEIRKIEKRDDVDINDISNRLYQFLNNSSDKYFQSIPASSRPNTGIIVCGYSKLNFFPDISMLSIPHGGNNILRPDINGEPDFGANWYGLTDAINRFHHGRDDRIFEIIERQGVEKHSISTISETMNREIQYTVLFNAMPLVDAIQYARFLVDISIARYRFVAGPELCGGEVQLATITRKQGFSMLTFT
jgi:hypothetical protein